MLKPLALIAFLSLSLAILNGCTSSEIKQTPVSMGAELYMNNCASCHGVSGGGASMMITSRGIAFDNPEWQKKYTDEQITNIIRNGRGSMPNFSFEPDEEEALVTYVRNLPKASN